MSEPLLRVHGVSKRFGGFTALDGIAVAVREGERFGLIGPNGSGKTTLINCICGTLRNDEGSIVLAGEDITRLPAYLRTRRGVSDQEAVIAEVIDEGSGIPRSELTKIFEPFYTTKPAGRGTGLGLSVCYSIVAAHNGRIEVDSAVGAGTTFRVMLPNERAAGVQAAGPMPHAP